MTWHRRFREALIVLALCVACGRKGEAPKTVETPGAVEVPRSWSELGVPSTGLARVWPDSDEHGFYADYLGHDRSALLAEVSRGLERAGYTRKCSAVDDLVWGFSNGTRQLALKIDMLGGLSLSLFDEQGKEPILHGLCFGRYRAGPWHRLTQEEKEALAKDPNALETPHRRVPRDGRAPGPAVAPDRR
jgi:hypothetical protein